MNFGGVQFSTTTVREALGPLSSHSFFQYLGYRWGTGRHLDINCQASRHWRRSVTTETPMPLPFPSPRSCKLRFPYADSLLDCPLSRFGLSATATLPQWTAGVAVRVVASFFAAGSPRTTNLVSQRAHARSRNSWSSLAPLRVPEK